ncbi:transglycosylase domain-containing protein [Modestobacter italicus]|uniref:transglycosylase domain-containing protein n=1 Tax=Modestobacter italicus (strain DSM 44449 / CECT 9708 / BC 501) TaxID=2732864 RepID=UPI0027E13FAE|nr:transglycosylase domain-containing protein [Modestobacter italicus]
MPPHDETARVTPGGGSVRRPPPARARAAGGSSAGARRPAVSGRARTTSSSSGGASGGARPAARSGGGGGRPPVKPPTGGRRPGGSGSGRPPGGGKKKRSAKQKRRRVLKVLAGTFVSLLVLLGVFVGVVYATTEVPSPDSIANEQTTVVYYADGVTEMARLNDGENRTEVSLEQISEPARNAVLAAENRAFYSDPGISFTGIVRAAWNNLTGGSTQGGSTITQQYVKNAFLSSDQTFSRKFKELFLAVKLDNEYSKDEILQNYLNTIYFGRSAYGIEAAANTYFGVPAAQLTPEQGAVLAVLIRNPAANDPESNPEGAQKRWGLVLDAMVEQGWLDSAARDAAVFPPVLPRTGSGAGIPAGPEGLIVRQVIAELRKSPFSYDDDDIYTGGLRITTTVDKAKQDAAVAAVNDVMAGEPQNLQEALVAIDPKTGGVMAYYGNAQASSDDPAVDTTDYAQALKQPGSSFKPYTLATALMNGYSVDTRRDGTSPQEFEDRPGLPVVNSGNAQCANCTLKEAMTKSLNTTYYGLAYEVGPELVADTARQAIGLPEVWDQERNDPTVPEGLTGKPTLASAETGVTGGSIGIGEYEVRPIQQAAGFATFAAGGVRHNTHFVASVAGSDGNVLGTGSTASEQAIPADVASDVTFALEDVAESSKLPLDGDRPVAAKTGTQGANRTDNSDAWMVGYTPSISTAVWIGTRGTEAIENASGRIIYGSGLPGEIWQQFMDTVLEGTPEEPLPSKALIKGDPDKSIPEPTTEAPASTSEARATATTVDDGGAEARARERARQEAERAAQLAEEARRSAAAEASRSSAANQSSTPPAAPTCGVDGLPACSVPTG